jgi:hypothetical protein
MSLMPSQAIRREVCLWVISPFGLTLSKDPGPKKHPNTWRKEESKDARKFMKVEKRGVHHNRYNGCCMNQRIKIPKVTWTSRIVRKRSTCQTSFNKVSLMKDDVNDEALSGTPKTLIPSSGVIN